MKDPHRSNPSRIARIAWCRILIALAATLALSEPARSELHYMPYADFDYQYNSNIFALPPDVSGFGNRLGDHIFEDIVGINALYNLSLQQLYATLEARHFDYDHFTSLSHYEYLVHGGIKWRLSYILDGAVDFRRERTMVPFIQFTGTQLFIQLQNITTASFHYEVTPIWQLQTQLVQNDLDSPRPGFDDLSVTEQSIREGLRFAGLARVSAGLDATFLRGHFSGDEGALSPRYSQMAVEGVAKYSGGHSSLDAALGYTRRNQVDAPSVGGITGSLNFQSQLTAKSSLFVKASRAVNTYVTYGTTEIDSGVQLGAKWDATSKLSVTPGYQWVYSTFPNTQFSADLIDRVDHYQLASLSVSYQALEWLSLQPYARYQTRRSDVGIDNFNQSIYGLRLELRLPNQADQPYVLTTPE